MFNINFMGRISSTANNEVQKMWVYNGSDTGSDETLATITASGYFNAFMVNLTLGLGPLSVNDMIYIVGNDASQFYTITTIITNVTVSAFSTAGLIGTANIDDLAVTTAKINDLAVTNGKLAANAVNSAKLATSVLQYAAVAITAAEFNGMYAAPKLLIAAGGANTQIIVEQLVLPMTFVAAQYAAGGVVAAQYDSTVHGAGVLATATEAAADFTGAAASTTFRMNPSVAVAPFSTTVNKGIYLSNQTAAFTTGDGTFVAHVWFRIIPTV